ncbi:MAG: tetratricopeptide repeat protein [Pirellulales bacterium]
MRATSNDHGRATADVRRRVTCRRAASATAILLAATTFMAVTRSPSFAQTLGGRAASSADSGETFSSRMKSLFTGKKDAPPPAPFEKSYSEMQSDFSSTGVVSPRIGYPEPQGEPTGFKKLTSAVAGSGFVTGIKSAFSKKDAAPASGAGKKPFSLFGKSSDSLPDDAVSVFSKSTVGPDVYVIVARRQEAEENLPKAIESYQRALEVEPHHLLATTGLARLREREGNDDEALKLFVDATKHHPEEAMAWNDLGMFQAKRRNSREAIRAMNRAVSLAPDRDLYRNNLATFLVDSGQTNQALMQLQAVHPPAIAHYSLGFLLKERGRTDEAIEYFRTAWQLDPQFEEARIALSMLSDQVGAPLAQGGDTAYPQRGSLAHESYSPDRGIAGPADGGASQRVARSAAPPAHGVATAPHYTPPAEPPRADDPAPAYGLGVPQQQVMPAGPRPKMGPGAVVQGTVNGEPAIPSGPPTFRSARNPYGSADTASPDVELRQPGDQFDIPADLRQPGPYADPDEYDAHEPARHESRRKVVGPPTYEGGPDSPAAVERTGPPTTSSTRPRAASTPLLPDVADDPLSRALRQAVEEGDAAAGRPSN